MRTGNCKPLADGQYANFNLSYKFQGGESSSKGGVFYLSGGSIGVFPWPEAYSVGVFPKNLLNSLLKYLLSL